MQRDLACVARLADGRDAPVAGDPNRADPGAVIAFGDRLAVTNSGRCAARCTCAGVRRRRPRARCVVASSAPSSSYTCASVSPESSSSRWGDELRTASACTVRPRSASSWSTRASMLCANSTWMRMPVSASTTAIADANAKVRRRRSGNGRRVRRGDMAPIITGSAAADERAMSAPFRAASRALTKLPGSAHLPFIRRADDASNVPHQGAISMSALLAPPRIARSGPHPGATPAPSPRHRRRPRISNLASRTPYVKAPCAPPSPPGSARSRRSTPSTLSGSGARRATCSGCTSQRSPARSCSRRPCVFSRSRLALAAAAGLAASVLLGYIVDRTVGMPSATGDIGNWTEPLGLASVLVEAATIAVAAGGILMRRRVAGPAR